MKRYILAMLSLALINVSSAEPVPRTVREALGLGPVQNLSCGLPPLPPLGCKVGPCVCDETGQNCKWTFICR